MILAERDVRCVTAGGLWRSRAHSCVTEHSFVCNMTKGLGLSGAGSKVQEHDSDAAPE
jgi:hypothetical protein